MLLSGAAAAPEFAVSMTPSSLTDFTSGGGYTSPRFTINIVGGGSTYSYLWSFSGGDANDFTITGSTTKDYALASVSGFNQTFQTDIVCTVTDDSTGDTFTASAPILITFESF